MNALYAIVILIGLAGILFAFINMIYPIKKLGIPTRKRGAKVLVTSFSVVILAVVGVLINPGKQAEQREVREVRGEQELVRAKQRTDETEHLPGRSEQQSVWANQYTDESGQGPGWSEQGGIGSEDGDSDEGRAHKTASDAATTDADPAGSSETDVVSDLFVLQWDLDGTDLLLAIHTDLPDTAEVIVSVGRRYYEVGNDDAYSRYYFSEEGNISKWRNPRRVPIDDKAWKADLMTHQSKMAALSDDLAFEIDHIEDQIGIQAVVHVNQSNPRFGGRGNPNLSGTAVSRIAGNNNWYIVEAEENIELLLTGMPPAKKAKNVAYNGLRKGKTYRLLKKTPLMTIHPKSVSDSNLKQTSEVLGKTLYISAGRVVRVISVEQSTGPHLWYKVEVVGYGRVKGWINSLALMRGGVVLE